MNVHLTSNEHDDDPIVAKVRAIRRKLVDEHGGIKGLEKGLTRECTGVYFSKLC
ncbi:MAG: hypothetical protein WCH77_11400 [Planctomycetota bacterium]